MDNVGEEMLVAAQGHVTELDHVPTDSRAVVVFGPVTFAGLQLTSPFLPTEDLDAVAALGRALATGEHVLAEPVVVLQRRAAENVGRADPLRDAAGDDGRVGGRPKHVGPTHLDAGLGLLAKVRFAFALPSRDNDRL